MKGIDWHAELQPTRENAVEGEPRESHRWHSDRIDIEHLLPVEWHSIRLEPLAGSGGVADDVVDLTFARRVNTPGAQWNDGHPKNESLSVILCARHSMTTRSMYAKQDEDEERGDRC
ncbi:hypothetical protein, partial [Rhizobacter sp. Root1238]